MSNWDNNDWVVQETNKRLSEEVPMLRTQLAQALDTIERYENALQKIASTLPDNEVPSPDWDDEADHWMRASRKRRDIAREALNPKEGA